MKQLCTVVSRELSGYLQTPVGYVFMSVFLLLIGGFTFYFSGFYEANRPELDGFFLWHPWMYLFLVPAVSMRLWAEEHKTGTIELLMTFPVGEWTLVLGKFLAAWMFIGLCLLGTMPLWVSVNYLGDPDNGVIVAGYIASFLLAGVYLAIGCCFSALTRNQVIAFITTACVGLLLTLAGFPMVINWLNGFVPAVVITAFSSLGTLGHYSALTRGVLESGGIFYFISMIVLWLYLTYQSLMAQKGR